MHHMRLLVLRAMRMVIMIQFFYVNVWFKPRCGPLRIVRNMKRYIYDEKKKREQFNDQVVDPR